MADTDDRDLDEATTERQRCAHRGRQLRTALGATLACVSFLVAASGARASSLDRASEHVALRAYQSYVSASLAALPAARQREEAFAASLNTSCPNVLAAVNNLPLTPARNSTATAIGEEAGMDVLISSYPALQPSLAALAGALERLHWSSRRTALTIQRSLGDQRRVLGEMQSELCTDARAIASTNAESTPAATLNFIATINAEDRGGGGAGVDLGVVRALVGFGTPADRRGWARALHRVQGFLAAYKAQYEAAGRKVEAALGISGT